MRKLLIVGLALGTAIPPHRSRRRFQPRKATDRAKRHLQNYIGRKLNKQTGITISPITTQCIRNACEASAIVCPAN